MKDISPIVQRYNQLIRDQRERAGKMEIKLNKVKELLKNLEEEKKLVILLK